MKKIIDNSQWNIEIINSLSFDGYNFLKMSDLTAAISCFYIAHHLDQENWYHTAMLGIALSEQKNYLQGLSYLNSAKNLSDNPLIDVHLIYCFMGLKKYDKAKEIANELSQKDDDLSKKFAKGISSILLSISK
ncbi:MAG: hypothetical protein KAH32_02115 [Chlamydiia bacterium]|nr:hypothetical protein [Chlamydiia bacterium]